MIGLLKRDLLPVHADLGIPLAVRDARHGKIHADLGAFPFEVRPQAHLDLLGNVLGNAHHVLGGPGHIALLLHKLGGGSAALGALFRRSLALVHITANAADELFHDSFPLTHKIQLYSNDNCYCFSLNCSIA
ncbi:hypothetical protein SDC9_146369 [bioreactor metagenome]|uniref:Uncharacterized protein n=1 Tax=bioreactor metagenome TaxID=1076179 RepID=A0A645EDI2_9ZZZZ